ncbi:hypothetical protein [Streptomyces endophyticus]|uniref:Uncharacterized protein n=1 Tax=Streptomyces endophyticus TaxID=714166 RepID=A0ABU6EZ87_9ACTN|nr:hypothetical protein [Streptomyces endophyticus]MEB8337056.1 hypothetical protein [Streptomyces endophyticus]
MRERAELLRSELEETEREVERLVTAREMVSQVLSQPQETGSQEALACPDGLQTVPKRGSVVPHRREGLGAGVLAPDYQRIMSVPASGAPQGGLRAKDLAQLLDLELVPAKIEGLRARLKRLVERGWVVQSASGMFAAASVSAG